VVEVSDGEVTPVRTSTTLDRITDAFFALDREWRFTYLNGRAEQMLDRDRDALLGNVIWDEFPETVETQFPEGFHRAMETQEPVAFEVFHKPMDTWFEARAYPSGSGLTVSLRDVTDRKERQRDLAQYETIVEAVHDGVFTLDEDHTVTFANDAVEATLGVEPSELTGDHIEALPQSASIDDEGVAELGHALDQIRRGDARERRLEFTYTSGGDQRIAETRMVPIGDGETAAVVRDVTEHRRFERVVTSLHSITPQLLDAEGDLEISSIAVHAAGEVLNLRISGVWLIDEELNRLEPVAATAGAHEEIGGLPHFPRGEGVVWQAFRQGDPALYDDVRELDGPESGTGLRSEIVVPVGDHGVLMAGETAPDAFDETDLELATILAANTEAALDRAERDSLLRRSRDALERQNERLDVVETVLSEDLRDQLAIAAKQARAAGAEDAVEPLMRARRLADDALELARGELSVGPRAPVEACEVAETAGELVDGVDVTVEDGGWLRADRSRLVRLFETLYLDARDRSDGDSPVRITVGVGDASTIVVSDDAEPLPESERDGAFDLDRASENDAAIVETDDAGPPGLGLAVAGEIAAAHGWKVDVEDAEDGVRFAITEVTTLEPGDQYDSAEMS
jgi:PAS domain S-box-containing protein